MKNFKICLFLIFCFLIQSLPVNAQKTAQKANFKVSFDKFTLPNGLDVIFHVDKSDPVVAVSLTAHVGSAREMAGRTGFAHLFEHLLFLESENLGKGGLDKLSARIGGSGANGSTSRDRTNYLQTVPKDGLEKMLWAEADKLGWFINTVTVPVLDKEKQVVKNEKRQGVDNQPYGHTSYVIDKALYPADHPYNWQVIGSLEDLQNAELKDVKDFFRRWYVPNNVTLTVAGDFDIVQAKKWVEKYFSEIKRGEDIPKLNKRPGVVTENIKLYHEDNFAKLPQLTMTWPTVEEYNPDSYPLDVLTQYLSDGKSAPLYKVLVEQKQLTSDVGMYNGTSEVSGDTQLVVRAFPGKKLDDVSNAVFEAFAMFEKDGISDKDLNRIKAGQETRFYNSLSNVLGKGAQLTHYNIFAGDPGYFEKDVNSILSVTPADVRRVYDKYIKGKNYIATSFVPKGETALALAGSKKADVVEEKILAGAEDEVDASEQAEYKKTPSSFDRSVEPPYGDAPELKIPEMWEHKFSNGMKVFGIQSTEVPLVDFEIIIDGGQLIEDADKTGVANMTAQMLNQGTKNKTPQQLEDAIEQLGARIAINGEKEAIRISGNTLSTNYLATLALVEEMLLEPRWDAKEFELTKQSTLSRLKQQEANPNAVAQNQFNILAFGKDSIYAKNTLGTAASVNSMTMEDLKAFYAKAISPSVARVLIVGSLDKKAMTSSLEGLNKKWKAKAVTIPTVAAPKKPARSAIYFYDVPNAKQSVLSIGYPALAETDKDFYPATVTNYILGGGSFASQLTQQLREGKGYTYGIGSGFSGTKNPGLFMISSGVRSNVTFESLELIKQILDNYGKNFTEADLATTKGFLVKSKARAFETSRAKLSMLDDISNYNWKPDYVKQQTDVVNSMSIEKIKQLSGQYLDSGKMIWLVVGDAKTQLPKLKELGFGEPVLLNK